MSLDLANLDIEFLLDKSGSMGTNRDCPGEKSRWEYAQETTLALAAYAEKHDPDGITVVPFAGSFKVYEGVTAAKVADVFAENQPMGATETGAVLKNRLDAYFARKEAGTAKSLLLLVMTDGKPESQDEVAQAIVEATRKMDRDEEIAIQFVQIGKDAGATKFLQFLDDELVSKHGAKFDIVDTVKIADVENFTFADLIQKSFAD